MIENDKKQPELVQGNGETAHGRFTELDYFFEQSFDMMCIAEMDGRFLRVNPAFERILGWTAKELLSSSYQDYVHADDMSAVGAELEKLNQGKAAVGYEHRFLCQDGSYKWLAWNAHPTPKGQVYAVARDVSDYRQTEENLRTLTEEMRESTSFLYSIIENLPTMLTIKDAEELRFVRFNKAGEEMIGFTADDLLGKDDYDIFPKDLADFFTSTDRDVLRRGETLDIPEELIETAHKGIRIFRTRKLPILDAEGQPKFLLSLSEDITERKQVEEAIAKQAVELQSVAEINTAVASRTRPESILQTAVDLTKDSFNFYHVHIYLLNEAGDELEVVAGSGKIGRQIVNEGRCIPLNQQQSLVARVARNRRGVIVNDVEADPDFLPHPLLPHTRSEMAIPMIVGQEFLGVIDVQAEELDRFIDTDRQIISTLAAQIATTLQNARRYEQIHESEAKYRTILENMENGYYETTLEGNFHFFNDALCRIFGYSAEELSGMSYKKIMAEEDRERVYEIFNGVHKTGEPVQSFEYNHICGDGSQRIINLSISRKEDAAGKVTGFRGLSRDVTERRQAQAELILQRGLLETQSEASPDGILLVTNDREILSHNRRFVEMWEIPQEVIERKDNREVNQHLLDVIVDAQRFGATTQYLYEHPDEDSRDEIALQDGRFLEITSSPIANQSGDYYGRVWYFHNITERKRAEQTTQEFLGRLKALSEATVPAEKRDSGAREWGPGSTPPS
jgi:PAS domain S-box-containing protein